MDTFKKVVLVTGGSSGIGKAICSRLTAAGHTVYGTSRKVSGLQNIEGIRLIGMDVTDDASVNAAIEAVARREGRIDVLINNAGLGIQGPIEDTGTDLARSILDTNVLGPHRVSRAVLPHMREKKSGLIINITSIAANFGLPYRGFYSASKAALERYSEALATEIDRFGIKVVAVEPGEFNTNIASSRLRPATIGDAYKNHYDRAMDLLRGSMSTSRDPDELARVIAKIIADPSPQAVYRVAEGKQKLSVLLKKLLPGRMFERMVRKHYE